MVVFSQTFLLIKMRQISTKRRVQLTIYLRQRMLFLRAHPVCQVSRHIPGLNPRARSRDIHHTAGRYGGNYLNEKTWLAVCREAHDWIHANPKAARAKGWLI